MARLSFEDDEPVDLDCGHTAQAGDSYISMRCHIYNKELKMNEYKEVKCCEDDDCIGIAMESVLNYRRYFTSDWVQLRTAYEKELIAADLSED